MPLEKVRKVLKIAKEPISLETPIGDEEDSHLGDFIEDKNAVLPVDAAIQANLRETTTRCWPRLTPREERVLRMRFGIGMNTDHTLEEVGQQFSVTRERIRQIEAKALRKLKHPSRAANSAASSTTEATGDIGEAPFGSISFMSVEFLITALIVVIMPGTGVLYTLAAALTRGGKAGVVAAFGCTLGIIPHIAAAIFGLAALLHTSALAFEAVRWAGIAYLLYLAWSALRAGGTFETDDAAAPRSMRDVVVTGILINVLNPKLSIFFLAFLPQFVSPGAPNVVPQMLGLSAVFMALTFVVFVAYGMMAATMRRRVLSSPRAMTWMRRAFAGAFAGLAVKLALTDR